MEGNLGLRQHSMAARKRRMRGFEFSFFFIGAVAEWCFCKTGVYRKVQKISGRGDVREGLNILKLLWG
jgi:hypothetical protein